MQLLHLLAERYVVCFVSENRAFVFFLYSHHTLTRAQSQPPTQEFFVAQAFETQVTGVHLSIS